MIIADLFNQLVLRRPSQRAIPNLDGPWRPNELLEGCASLAPEIIAPDSLASGDDGTLYVASGKRILALRGRDLDQVTETAAFEGIVSCLAWDRRIGLVAGVTGQGVWLIAADGSRRCLSQTAGRPLLHPCGVAVDAAGAVLVTEGSARRSYEDWVWDLMEKGSSGRLLRFPPGSEQAEVLVENLAFPLGVAVQPDSGAILVAEAWRHRVVAISPVDRSRRVVLENLAGYPARIIAGPGDGWWLSFFALRTQLVEFVLREDKFRRRMMATIDAELWIAPSLSAEEHHLQPVQIGALRSQNVKKPWAPPRSYGLVVQLDTGFEPVASFHSRANGHNHGTTGLAMMGERLFLAAKGANRILLPLERKEVAS